MQEEAILEIDQAALGMIKALDLYASDLTCCMDMTSLEALRAEIISLRRALLGIEMGILYQHQDYDQGLLSQAAATEKVPLNLVAAKVIEKINRK